MLLSFALPATAIAADLSEEVAVREARAFLDDQDHGRAGSAYDRFTPAMKTQMPFAAWENLIEDLAAAPTRKIIATTIYDTPNGRFIAVDHAGPTTEGGVACGYVVVTDGGAISRSEYNVVPGVLYAASSPARRRALETAIGCKATVQ
ncbi:MAG: hypothetical protein AAF321_02980 [Pseudomonadota bacterium]